MRGFTCFDAGRWIIRQRLGTIVALINVGLLMTAVHGQAGTVVSGNVGGVWNIAGSPYWVEADLLVPADSILVIDPGVEVRFRGPYSLLVNGCVDAAGTESDSIVFTWDSQVPENEWRGIRFVRSDSGSKLEYCRIEHVRSSTQYPDVRGGGVYCMLCSLTIRHCLIQENVSHNGNWNGTGGGVVSVNAWPLIEHCTIRNNRADSGGGIATLEDQSDTTGVPVIRSNEISRNSAPYCGGGIYVGAFSTPVIENNRVTNNSAERWGGGGIALWTTNELHKRTVNNNIIADNWTSTDGGGFYIRYDYSTLVNNTVVNNTADSAGGGVFVLNFGGTDFPHLRNSIIWGNAAGSGSSVFLIDDSTEVEIVYCDVEGGWTGIGNIDQDPLFADTAFHLTPGSPCIDVGDTDSAYNDMCFPPSQGTDRNDMGIYGGPLACRWPQEDPTSVEDQYWGEDVVRPARLSLDNYPNPFNPNTEIRLDLPRKGAVDLTIYDIRGRLVRQVLKEQFFPAGRHTVSWDGSDEGGVALPSGIYLCQVESEDARVVKKMVLLK